jgi:elongation factor P
VISTADFKNGLTIELDGEVYQITEFEHVKPGRGSAFVRTKLRNVRTGNVFDKTFRSGERVEQADVQRRKIQYLYGTGDSFFFMDLQDFDQIELTAAQVGESAQWIKENEELTLIRFEGEFVGLELPLVVEREVAQTDPGVRGDTATGGSKPAVLEGGATVQVPLFINIGDVLKVDTRTKQYVERASK